MEVINKVLYLTGNIGIMQNAGKMGRKVQGFSSIQIQYNFSPYFRWCYTGANAQEVVTEIFLKEPMEKMACCMLDHALKAIMCQKRLISCMGSIRSCIIR